MSIDSRAMKARAALLASLPLLVLGCTSVDSTLYNLRQVHDADGDVRRIGAPVGAFEYQLRRLVGDLNVNITFVEDLSDELEQEAIEDPLEKCLDALLDLADFDSDMPRIAGIQVETYTWLAVEDEYVLGRERSVLELGRAGRRLAIDGPRPLPEDAVPATPGEVGAAVLEIVRTTRRTVDAAREDDILAGAEAALEADVASAAGQARDLAEACERTAALTLDREGARRVLSVCNALMELGLGGAAGGAIHELSLEMQRRCVRQALAAALGDPHAAVRAAAVEASVVASRNRAPRIVRLAFLDPTEVVFLRAVDMIAEHGLPAPEPDADELSASQLARFERDWIELLVDATVYPTSRFAPDAHTRRVAMRASLALGRVSGAGFYSLRGEDWQAWARSLPSLTAREAP